MASTALTKAREEVDRVKNQVRLRMRNRSEKEKMVTIKIAGGAGIATSAAGCAFVDHHYAKDGQRQMMVGKTPIPVTGGIGAVLAIGALMGAKKAPEVAAFFGAGGGQAVGISIYNAVRQHLEDKADTTDDDDDD